MIQTLLYAPLSVIRQAVNCVQHCGIPLLMDKEAISLIIQNGPCDNQVIYGNTLNNIFNNFNQDDIDTLFNDRIVQVRSIEGLMSQEYMKDMTVPSTQDFRILEQLNSTRCQCNLSHDDIDYLQKKFFPEANWSYDDKDGHLGTYKELAYKFQLINIAPCVAQRIQRDNAGIDRVVIMDRDVINVDAYTSIYVDSAVSVASQLSLDDGTLAMAQLVELTQPVECAAAILNSKSVL